MATAKKKENTEIKKDGKNEAIDAITDQINKKYGPGSFMRLGSNKTVNVDVISTGALTLDHALGVGGIPRGRITEIYGHEASGKTTLTLHIIAEAQKSGGYAAFIDAEHALDPTYASALGVDIDNLYISQPNSGEEALEILEKVVSSTAFDSSCRFGCGFSFKSGTCRRYWRRSYCFTSSFNESRVEKINGNNKQHKYRGNIY